MRAKQFWDVSHAKWVLESFMKDLTHENDGLIFSPATDVRAALQVIISDHILSPCSHTSQEDATNSSNGSLQISTQWTLSYLLEKAEERGM